MARFLFATAPDLGHVTPSVPIAKKLIERGHEVVWITGRVHRERIETIGARFHPLPRERDPGELDMHEFYPQMKELKGLAEIKWIIKHMLLDTCSREIEIINTILMDFPADVLVGDTVAFALGFMGEKIEGQVGATISLLPLSLPSRDTAPWGLGLLPGKNIITKARNRLLNFLTYRVLLRDITTYTNDIRRELGLEPLNGHFFRAMWQMSSLIMQISTPAFEYPRSDQPEYVHFIGPVLSEADDTFQPPHWWSDLNSSETVILVNQGTVATNLDDLILPTIKGLEGEKMLVVAVPVKQGQFGEIPSNVRAEPFIPFDHLLPHVNVMVTNGGYGGTQFALAHGIPLVVAGATEDKMEVAARVEWSGAGINLRKQRPSPGELRDAVKEVLVNPAYRDNAKHIQADFAKYDAPTRAAELLESLASGELCQ